MGLVGRVIAGHVRTMSCAVLALVTFLLLPGAMALPTRVVVAWDVSAVALIVLFAILFARGGDDASMAFNAEKQDEGEWTIFWITLGGALFSFAAVALVLSGIKDMAAWERNLHVVAVAVTLLASWLLTHVVFGVRYAHEYYARTPGLAKLDGGLDFPGDDSPDYWDFMYFALVLGMCFQVSDVQITSRKLRRLAAVHGLLAFLFNTVIVALTVNIAASLL